MARRKKEQTTGLLDELQSVPLGLSVPADVPPAPAPAPAPSSTPKVFQYTPLASGEKWQVEKAEDFIIEFGLPPHLSAESQMVQFHELGLKHSRPWLICRRLYGIGPMILPADADPDDFRPSSRAQICEDFGLQPDELQAELDALRTLWLQLLESNQRTETPAQAQPEKPKVELAFGDEVLREFGFEERMFKVMVYNPETKTETPRSPEDTRLEREWFCKRVTEWRKMLEESGGATLARAALINDLYLRRFDQELAVLAPSSKKFEDLYKSKRQIEQQYQEQLKDLQEMFPEMSIASKVSFHAQISDLNKAHRDYYGNGDKRLVDKIFTATEIEVLLRMSVQATEPKYRFGLNIALVEAIHGLYDPNWRPQFKPSVLKKLDAGFKRAVVEMREAQNEPLVDLDKGVRPGEGDDYPDLKEPTFNDEKETKEKP
jgi:hypothetical protein